MSWYKDPELFLSCWERRYYIDRILKKYNVPLQNGDIRYVEELDFSKHLSIGNNKENDYEAFKSSIPISFGSDNKYYVNSQGLVVHWDTTKHVGTWSRVDQHDSIFYSLPGIVMNPYVTVLAEKLQAVEKMNSELVAENSGLKDEVTNLQEQLNQEKNDRQALEKQVFDLSSKLEVCCVAGSASGSADVEPLSCIDDYLFV